MAARFTNAVPKDRAELLGRAWTEASQLYLEELVPRFDPWLQSALRELQHHPLPPGPIIVPCCGPGHELVMLHALYGRRRAVVGLDLSPGMVELAEKAIHDYLAGGTAAAAALAAAPPVALPVPPAAPSPSQAGRAAGRDELAGGGLHGYDGGGRGGGAALEAHVADASCLDRYAPAAAVLSVFGLQQMAGLAPEALASWARCLAPGGVGVVVLWPSRVETTGPWVVFDQVVQEKAAADAGRPPPPPDAAASAPPSDWEARLTESLLRQAAEGTAAVELLVDRLESHSMEWESLEHFWKVMTEGGPWRARRLAQGDAVMRDLWTRFSDSIRGDGGGGGGVAGGSDGGDRSGGGRNGDGGGQHGEGGSGSGGGGGDRDAATRRLLVHRPSARVLVFRRRWGEETGQAAANAAADAELGGAGTAGVDGRAAAGAGVSDGVRSAL